jgi:hypothetical protein
MSKKCAWLSCLILLLCFSAAGAKNNVPKWSINNGILYFRATGLIYKDHIDTMSGKPKYATEGNILAIVVVNFANLTDQPVKGMGMRRVTLTVNPENIFLLNDRKEGEKRKTYSGARSTQLLKKDGAVNPFNSPITLKPGEDMVRAMCFHIPKNAKIVGIMYKLEEADPLIIDYREEPQR